MNDTRPLDDYIKPGEPCECKFTPYDEMYPDPDDPPWHYKRRCQWCKSVWFALHCPHDGKQNPCPKCGYWPEVVKETEQ